MPPKHSTTPSTQPTSWALPGASRLIPHDYQKRAVLWLVRHAEAALLLDPGLGKTAISLLAFLALRKKKLVGKMLVVAPLRPAALVWTKNPGGELAKWSDFGDLTVSLVHGSEKKRIAALAVDADIYVINYEGLSWLCTKVGKWAPMDELLKKGVNVLCFDELSKMKHSQTKRFKVMKPWLRFFKRRWGLTGSPVANGMLDLFGQIYALDMGRRLGRYITHYRFNYFNATGYGGYTWVIQEGAEKKIYAKLSDLALSMRAEDHLDLPELVERNLYVDLPTKARRIYKEMEDELLAWLDSGEVTAANAAVASGKCRQIASGGIYVEDVLSPTKKRGVEEIHDAKVEALADLVDELQGAPLLVAYEFHHDLARIRRKLGKVPAIEGGMSMKTTAALTHEWNAGKLPVLCGQPGAMAHGINLQACGHHIAWFSLTWNYELYDQFIRRVYRQGQRNRVMVYRLLARETVDEAVLKALTSKERGQNTLLEALKTMRRSR